MNLIYRETHSARQDGSFKYTSSFCEAKIRIFFGRGLKVKNGTIIKFLIIEKAYFSCIFCGSRIGIYHLCQKYINHAET